MKIDRAIKIIAIVSLGFSVLAITIARNSPSTGYEPSIYSATPTIFWLVQIFSFISGIVIVCHQMYTRASRGSLWFIGLILILASYVSLLSFWIIRGYALWSQADALTHLGRIQDLVSDGHIMQNNIYPITYIYLVQLSYILDLTPAILHKLVPFYFALLYLGGMFLLAKSLLPNRRQAILVTLVSATLIQGSYFHLTPNHLATFFLPSALFILINSFLKENLSWKLLLIIIVFLTPIFHPVPGFIFLLILLTIWLPGKVFFAYAPKTLQAGYFRFDTNILLLFVVWAITWISSFYVWDATIRNLYKLFTEGGDTQFNQLISGIQYAANYGYSIQEQFLKVYGGTLVSVVLALIALPILWIKIRKVANYRYMLSLYGPLGAIVVTIIVFGFLNIPAFDQYRFVAYVQMISSLFVGFILYELIKNRNRFLSRFMPSLAIILLVGLFIHGLLRLYPSPYILSANDQITRTKIAGMGWFLHNKDFIKPTIRLNVPISRYFDQVMTSEERQSGPPEEIIAPYHFGYSSDDQLGRAFSQDVYLVLDEADRMTYSVIFPEMEQLRFSSKDFAKLEQDPSVFKIYSNGGLDVYNIYSKTLSNS